MPISSDEQEGEKLSRALSVYMILETQNNGVKDTKSIGFLVNYRIPAEFLTHAHYKQGWAW